MAYQIDPAHDGNQALGAPRAGSLPRKWKSTLGGTSGSPAGAGDVSYPVIAGGRVFVTVENTQSYGTHLYALNASTGARDWSVAGGLGGRVAPQRRIDQLGRCSGFAWGAGG